MNKTKIKFGLKIAMIFMLMFSIYPNITYAKQAEKTDKNVRLIIQFEEQNRHNILSQIKQFKNTTIKYEYTDLIVGASIDIPIGEIENLKQIKEITYIEESKQIIPHVMQAKQLTQALQQSPKYKHDGHGMVIALLDSGMDTKHKDMRLDDGVEPKIKNITPTINNEFTLKVPHGYNYIGNNTELIDDIKKPHGMHLAGILAGNATDEDIKNQKGIDGIAPNAQLLAYKVFSDNLETYVGTGDDVVYAAMEDALKHGADVISLSIGQYGIGKPGDTFYRAVEKAHEKGVVVVAAMGNASTSSSTSTYDNAANNELGLIDTATTVSVAANPYVIGVGSARNLALPVQKIKFDELEVGMKSIGTKKLTQDEYDVMYLKTDQINNIQNMDLANKIVLIDNSWYVSDFVSRLKMAQVAGIILANVNETVNSDYYEDYFVLGTEDEIYKGIFAGTISGKDATKLKELLKNKTHLNISVNEKVEYNQIFDKTSISGFSSWGPAIDLELKPDIVAPGEDVYSTLNNNTYGLMSGTSMAAPHIAGASTILLPFVREKQKPTGMNDADLTRLIMMNTAKPIEDATSTSALKIENSPRQQGAGMLQIANAQDSEVVIYHNNKGAISLKEIGAETTFNVTLQNLSTNPHTFQIQTGQVLTSKDFEVTKQGETKERVVKEIHSAVIEDASINTDTNEITLNANEKKEVTFTLKTGIAKQQFAEGFIYFIAKDDHPNLSIPYFGFVGDWASEPILDAPMWDTSSKLKQTGLLTRYNGKQIWLGSVDINDTNANVDPEMIAITSTNAYESLISDVVDLHMILLRDALEMEVEILDENKNVVKLLRKGAAGPRFRYADYLEGGVWGNYKYDIKWNGQLYNPQTGEVEAAPEGQYYYQIKVRNSLEKPFQTTLLPIKIDNTKPEMQVNTDLVATEHKIKIHAQDNNKIWQILVNLDGKDLPVTKIDEENYEIQNIALNDLTENEISIKAMDIAGNHVDFTQSLQPVALTFENFADLSKKQVEHLVGVINKDATYIEATLNGEIIPSEITNHEFTIETVKAVLGKNNLNLKFKDASNKLILEKELSFIQDLAAPTMNLNIEYDEENEDLLKVVDGKFHISGKISDDITTAENLKLYYYKSEHYGKKEYRMEIPLKADGTFHSQFFAEDFKYGILFEAVDEFGKKTTQVYNLNDELEEVATEPFYFQLLNFNTFITKQRLDDIEVLENGNYLYTFVAETDFDDYAISINNGEKQLPDEGRIEYKVELHAGFNPLKVSGYDEEGNLVVQRLFHIFIDVITPTLNLVNFEVYPTDEEGIAGIVYTNKPEVTLEGHVSDHGLYWGLIVNGDEVEKGGEWLEFKETGKDFNRTIHVENNDLLEVYAGDFFENHTDKNRYKIKIDTQLPTVQTNIENKERYNVNEFIPNVSVNDNIGIKFKEITLNGEQFKPNTPISKVGNYTLKYKVIDYAGNMVEDEIKFRVDEKDQDTLKENLSLTQTKTEIYYDEIDTLKLEDFITTPDDIHSHLLTNIDVNKEENNLKIQLSDDFGNIKFVDVSLKLKERKEKRTLKAYDNPDLGAVSGNFSDQLRFIAEKVDIKVEELATKAYQVYDLSLFDVRKNQVYDLKEDVLVTLQKEKPEVEAVYYLDKEHNLHELGFTQDNTTLSFHTNHFSNYVVVYKDTIISSNDSENNTIKLKEKEAIATSDVNNIYYIILIICTIGILLQIKRKD